MKKRANKMQEKKFVYFGTPEISAILLSELIKNGWKPALAVTGEAKPVGRGQKLVPTPVAQIAQKAGVPVATPQNLKNLEFLSQLSTLNSQFATLSAYGKILPKEILDLFPKGILNPHPSLLPKYRGPSPIQSAILAGDKETGVTVIRLDEEIDHGPIVTQKSLEITGEDTYETLSKKLVRLSAELLTRILPEYLEGKIDPQKQAHSQATITQKVSRNSGFFDIDNPPKNLERMIRAYHPWPGVWTRNDGKIIKFLPDKKIQVEGKRAMSFEEFKNGHPSLKPRIEKIEAILG